MNSSNGFEKLQMFYKKEMNCFWFYEVDAANYSFYTRSVAIGLLRERLDNHILYYVCKHGTPNFVEGWSNRLKNIFSRYGEFHRIADVVIIASDHWDVFELNSIINNVVCPYVYLERFLGNKKY